MKVLASPDAVEYVRERGGSLFVWVDRLRYQGAVNFLEASTNSPGSEWHFRRLQGDAFDILIDSGELELPEELHIELSGRRHKRLRAYWNGATFAADPRPGDADRRPSV
ncbi:MAG TPA: hypothetical protein VGR41_03150 [Actinomycetota bacterium]|jgi:hypothetical protein|nr:hypothetical protein [Actinomycetota bacterium]